MRTVILSDACASELWTALNTSTGEPRVVTPPVEIPPPPPPAPPTAPPIIAPGNDGLGRVDPYQPPGLYAVVMQVGTPDQYQRASQALGGDQQYRARTVNSNAVADPLWTAAISQLIAGIAIEAAYANVSRDAVKPSFTLQQLGVAAGVISSL